MKLVIDVDDVHPEKGYGYNDKEIQYLDKLHDEFGCRFTLFMPINWHNKFDITENRSWFLELVDRGYFEIAAHGVTHTGVDGSAREFLNTSEVILAAKLLMITECFDELDYSPSGIKPPGWDSIPEAANLFCEFFDYFCTDFRGHSPVKYNDSYNIPYTYSIHESYDLKNYNQDIVILHSHINEICGDNGWNSKLYEKVRSDLSNVEFDNRFMVDLINE